MYGLKTGKIKYDNPTSVTGDIIFCNNLKILVLIPGSVVIPAGGA